MGQRILDCHLATWTEFGAGWRILLLYSRTFLELVSVKYSAISSVRKLQFIALQTTKTNKISLLVRFNFFFVKLYFFRGKSFFLYYQQVF